MSLFPKLTRDERHALAGHRSSLYARLLPIAEQEQYGERIEVDLDHNALAYFHDGRQTNWCDIALVGTLAADGTFLWGFCDPGIPSQASGELRAAAATLPGLEPALAIPRFAVDATELVLHAERIAVAAGYLGVYEAPIDGGLALLACTPWLTAEKAASDLQNEWCTLCGQHRSTVKKILRQDALCQICDECVERSREIADGSDRGDPDAEVMPDMVPCFLSGSYGPRLFTPFTALAYDVLDQCVKLIAG